MDDFTAEHPAPKKRRRHIKHQGADGQTHDASELEVEIDEEAAVIPTEVDELGLTPIATPVPFDPASLPAGTFVTEPWDKFLPGPGFIRDFTYAMKGTETNTGFSIWGAVWAISTVLARDAWLSWFPSKMLPNFYIFLIAPPAICKKSTSAIFAANIVKKVPDFFTARGDHLLAFKKGVSILEERATMESFNILLKAEEKAFILKRNGSTRLLTVKKPSQFSVCADELTTFLGQSSYNVGLVDRLTKLYDGNDSTSTVTMSRGKETFEDIYVNMIGATTPDGVRMSLPETAFGGGFMSRVVTVFSDIPYRVFAMPAHIKGAPVPSDLVERLAWIAENCAGEYRFTPEAEEYFTVWYKDWKMNLLNGKLLDNNMTDYRFDVNLRKLAMVIRCQRYQPGNMIELEDVAAAQKILRYTFAFSKRALEEAGPTGNRNLSYVRRKLQRVGNIARKDLVRYCSGNKIDVAELDTILWQLCQEALVTIERNGAPANRPSSASNETYIWIGSTNEDTEKEALA